MFLRRLVNLLQPDFDVTLLDLRKADGKVPLFKGHIISPFHSRFLSILWLQWRLLCQNHGVLHFHFSDVKGLIFVAFLLRRSQATILSLHHGVTSVSARYQQVLRFLAPLIRRKIGTIHALNTDQQAFYQSVIGFADSAVFQCPTHISPDDQDQPLTAETRSLLAEVMPYVLTSGVGNRLNRADLVLDYWATRPKDGMHLVVSIYGDIDPHYADELRKKATALPTATLIGAMPENDFNALLKSAAVYIRPAEVDSFGIAVADSLAFGTPVLASDACNRADDVHVFGRYNMAEMADKLEEILLETTGRASEETPNDRSADYRKLYSLLAATDLQPEKGSI